MATATTHSTRVRLAGMLLSALAGHDTPTLRTEHARLEVIFENWAAEADAEVPPRTIPIRDLVGVQFGAILSTAAHFAGQSV